MMIANPKMDPRTGPSIFGFREYVGGVSFVGAVEDCKGV
jgi:hypothetical protein